MVCLSYRRLPAPKTVSRRALDTPRYRGCVGIYMSPGPDEGRCGAQLRGQPGVHCRKFPIEGRTRCRLHGGKSPTGYDHPSFVHGRRSRYRLRRPDYEQAASDLAMARARCYRAVAAGSSGLAESQEVGRCVQAYFKVIEGKVLPRGLLPGGVIWIGPA